MSTLEVLKAARELISVRERWTQGLSARNARGARVKPQTEEATCWCAIGAICRTAEPGTLHRPVGPDSPVWPAIDELSKGLRFGLAYFNDHNPHSRVLARFDRTIARLEKEATG